jgi:predicted ArsR family transcriptional regulator
MAIDTSLRRAATEAEARALASAIRLRILRVCLDRAMTNKEIAARLDANPATTLHHVRKLVATGFLAPEEERRGPRGSREVPYKATGKSWTLSVGESNPAGSNRAMVDAFLAELRLVEEEEPMLARLGLRLSPEDLAELKRRLQALMDEYVARETDLAAEPYSMFVALHRDRSRD